MVLLIDPGGENDKNAVQLGTRKRTFIPNEMRREAHPDNLKEDLRKCKEQYPDIIVRSVSNTYNCAGMVFATRRTWVDPEHIYTFLTEDGYQKITEKHQIVVGDVVLYKDLESNEIVHVGIIIDRNDDFENSEIHFKVLSKWGPWAEIVHAPNYVLPSFGIPFEYWTHRKSV